MDKRKVLILMVMGFLCGGTQGFADTFNTYYYASIEWDPIPVQFEINFVTISNETNPSFPIPAGDNFNFVGVSDSYRISTFEISHKQWSRFKAGCGHKVKGSPPEAYDWNASYDDWEQPENCSSWFEAAQFVNWLNLISGHHVAYNFTGTEGTDDYAFTVWDQSEADGTNLYRHKDAFYFLPTENEWVKAAYWNGTTLQEYATKAGETLFQGNGSNGGWNYWDEDPGPDGAALGLWNVGSGSEELNGTYDMMGNAWEWLENPLSDLEYSVTAQRTLRGNSYAYVETFNSSSSRWYNYPSFERSDTGFRIASQVPEPTTMLLLVFGSVWMRKHEIVNK